MVQQTSVPKSPCCTKIRLKSELLKFSQLFFPHLLTIPILFLPLSVKFVDFLSPWILFTMLLSIIVIFKSFPGMFFVCSGYRDILWCLQHSIPPPGLSSILQSPDIQAHGALMQINFIACLELHGINVTQKKQYCTIMVKKMYFYYKAKLLRQFPQATCKFISWKTLQLGSQSSGLDSQK